MPGGHAQQKQEETLAQGGCRFGLRHLLTSGTAAECQKALGIKLTVETINANDIQARTTSAIQSGTGPRHHQHAQQSAVPHTKFPQTWEQYCDAGKKLKARGGPIGLGRPLDTDLAVTAKARMTSFCLTSPLTQNCLVIMRKVAMSLK